MNSFYYRCVITVLYTVGGYTFYQKLAVLFHLSISCCVYSHVKQIDPASFISCVILAYLSHMLPSLVSLSPQNWINRKPYQYTCRCSICYRRIFVACIKINCELIFCALLNARKFFRFVKSWPIMCWLNLLVSGLMYY